VNHEDHEGHEETHEGGLRPLRVPSSLPAETERVIAAVIGCAIGVHRALGPGFLESIYRKAMCIELEAQRLRFATERAVSVTYRGVAIPGQRIDLIVEEAVVAELKCVDSLDEIHRMQVLSYLRTTRLRAGLLINFKVPILRNGIRRIVL
jgi:GxxExxY protein